MSDQGGTAAYNPSELPDELRKRLDDHFDNIEAKVGLDKPGLSKARYNINDIADPDEAEAAFAEQKAAASKFTFAKGLKAHLNRDQNSLMKMGVKAGGESAGSSGGYLVPEFFLTDQWIDLFRPMAIARQLGVKVLTMPTHIEHVAQLTADVSVSWGAENAVMNPSDPAYGQITFTAKKQYAYAIVSNELLKDSNPAVEGILRESIARKMALDESQQILLGTAAGNNPVGILNTAGIGTLSLGVNGASPTFDNFVDALYTLETANVPPAYSFAFHPRVKQSLRKLKASTSGLYYWDIQEPKVGSPGEILGNTYATTTQFSVTQTQGTAVNATTALVGNFDYGWLMERQDMEWLVSNVAGTAFQNDQTWIRVTRRMDFGVVMPAAFVAMTGILP